MSKCGILMAAAGLWLAVAATAGDLKKDFQKPPEATKPRCYWYWMYGQVSREGITRDLEAMSVSASAKATSASSRAATRSRR